jgi:hypothetical protein
MADGLAEAEGESMAEELGLADRPAGGESLGEELGLRLPVGEDDGL